MTNYLPVVEKFHSLQGEGFHTGKSAYFIRLAGCNVGCSWCDTKKSWDSSKYPLIRIDSLIREVKKARTQGASFLVITGGEPLHHNLDYFCNELKIKTEDRKFQSIKVHIETSGVNTISGDFDWITLSPKRHNPPEKYFLKMFNEMKVIINDMRDIKFAKEIKNEISNLDKEFDLTEKKKSFFVQPVWNNKKAYSLAIEFVKNNPNWSLSLQTHKYLNLQ